MPRVSAADIESDNLENLSDMLYYIIDKCSKRRHLAFHESFAALAMKIINMETALQIIIVKELDEYNYKLVTTPRQLNDIIQKAKTQHNDSIESLSSAMNEVSLF